MGLTQTCRQVLLIIIIASGCECHSTKLSVSISMFPSRTEDKRFEILLLLLTHINYYFFVCKIKTALQMYIYISIYLGNCLQTPKSVIHEKKKPTLKLNNENDVLFVLLRLDKNSKSYKMSNSKLCLLMVFIHNNNNKNKTQRKYVQVKQLNKTKTYCTEGFTLVQNITRQANAQSTYIPKMRHRYLTIHPRS